MTEISNDDLNEMDDDFRDAETKEGGRFSNEPDAKHTFRIVKAYFDKGKKSQDTMIVYELEVVDCNLGHTVRKYAMLSKNGKPNKEKMSYVKGELKKIGFTPKNMRELNLVLDEIIGKEVEGQTVTKNGFTNRYFNQPLTDNQKSADNNEPLDDNNPPVDDTPF